jgi:ribose transport system substrate-binding protein
MIFGIRKRISFIGVLMVMLIVVAACGDDDATTGSTGVTKVASVAGGPHPFFDPWEEGTADAVTAYELGGGTYEFPPQWELTAQNNLVETLVAQGYNAFNIFPGDANGTNALLAELEAQGIPSIAAGGCTCLTFAFSAKAPPD